ncbi:MAG: hypothetical protein RL693_1638 [Verrucomicrobiota bacterium]|jgi:hypothetical protein
MEDVMSTMQVKSNYRAQITSRFDGLTIKPWGGQTLASICPRTALKTPLITAMNPGETVVYQHKPCIVLDAFHEGYPDLEEHVLLEELTHYSTSRGRVRHLAHLGDLDQERSESLPVSPSA